MKIKTQLTRTFKVMLREKFIAISAFIEKYEKFQINNLTMLLEKQEQAKPKSSRWK
jgi:hypothetical protein